jgi:hypothetical protein
MRIGRALSSLFLCGLLTACSHASKSSSSGESSPAPVTEYHLHKLVPYTLKVRRPSFAGIDPKVGPGGADYRSAGTPDAHYECKDAAWLFRDVNLAELRDCVTTEKAGHASYVLKRVAVPYLEMEEDGETLSCLKKLLPKIPLPREIFFQSTEGGRLACYGARLHLEADEIAGFKMPFDRAGMKLEFPLTFPPLNDPQTVMLLMTWAMTPFWEKGTIAAHLVPDRICSVCLGEKTMLKPTDPEPVLWPTD